MNNLTVKAEPHKGFVKVVVYYDDLPIYQYFYYGSTPVEAIQKAAENLPKVTSQYELLSKIFGW